MLSRQLTFISSAGRVASFSAMAKPSPSQAFRLLSTTLSRSPLPTSSARVLPLSRQSTSANPSLLTRRALSSMPTHSTPGGPDPPSLYPQQPPSKPARSATSEFYRALVPAMLHCLALGSIVYYALELAWMWLKREKEGEELKERVERLEKELEEERTRGGKVGKGAAAGGGTSWWKLW
ncbi:hypothetical protein JCM8097_001635 [Rhodosporidiobolus ruineniae]